jgi:hypothetical protein
MNNALSALCQRRLGIDIGQLSEAELCQSLPDIINAVASEYVMACRQLVDVQKAARLFAPDSDQDPNAVLESVLPV